MYRSHTWHELNRFDRLRVTLATPDFHGFLLHLTCAKTGESATGNVEGRTRNRPCPIIRKAKRITGAEFRAHEAANRCLVMANRLISLWTYRILHNDYVH
jgi:hypothetical protein